MRFETKKDKIISTAQEVFKKYITWKGGGEG